MKAIGEVLKEKNIRTGDDGSSASQQLLHKSVEFHIALSKELMNGGESYHALIF